jgi:predicted nuclease of predicted toxin-antitoxin system
MMLLADESVDKPIVDRLRQDGHDIVYIAEVSPSVTDDQVLDEANPRDALLLTGDKDFGELVYRLGRVHAGIALIRLGGLPAALKAEIVAKVFQNHATEMPGAFSVISPGGVRIRKPPVSEGTPPADGPS